MNWRTALKALTSPEIARLSRRRAAISIGRLLCLGAAAAGILPAIAADPAFPSKPVRIIVNFPAGGTADVLARVMGQQLSEQWKQPVVVENRVGAGGNIGAAAAYGAEADGHTLLLTAPGPLAINQHLYPNLPFDPARFTPVSVIAAIPNVVTVRADLPVKTLQELVAYAQSGKDRLVYVSAGNGSTQHLSGEMLSLLGKMKMLHVPYKGEGPALNDLLAGRVDVFVGNISAVLKFQQTGKVRLLALASPTRSNLAPAVPTTAEAGMPNLVASAWFAFVLPPNTPDPIVQRIRASTTEALKVPDVQARIRAQGAEILNLGPQESAAYITADRARWKQVVESGQIKLD